MAGEMLMRHQSRIPWPPPQQIGTKAQQAQQGEMRAVLCLFPALPVARGELLYRPLPSHCQQGAMSSMTPSVQFCSCSSGARLACRPFKVRSELPAVS